MKTDVNKRLLKLVSTETLLQLGFERATEHALNIITDVFAFYLESLVRKAAVLQLPQGQSTGGEDEEHSICKYIIEDTYEEEQYQTKELMKFMEQQAGLKAQLADKHDINCDESLFHALRLLPKGVTLRSVFKNTKTSTLEEKKSAEITEDILVDEFMEGFIQKCSCEGGARPVVTYSFDCLKIVDNPVGNALVPFDRMTKKPNEWICGYRDQILAAQEFFIEDFYGTEKYQVPM